MLCLGQMCTLGISQLQFCLDFAGNVKPIETFNSFYFLAWTLTQRALASILPKVLKDKHLLCLLSQWQDHGCQKLDHLLCWLFIT